MHHLTERVSHSIFEGSERLRKGQTIIYHIRCEQVNSFPNINRIVYDSHMCDTVFQDCNVAVHSLEESAICKIGPMKQIDLVAKRSGAIFEYVVFWEV